MSKNKHHVASFEDKAERHRRQSFKEYVEHQDTDDIDIDLETESLDNLEIDAERILYSDMVINEDGEIDIFNEEKEYQFTLSQPLYDEMIRNLIDAEDSMSISLNNHKDLNVYITESNHYVFSTENFNLKVDLDDLDLLIDNEELEWK